MKRATPSAVRFGADRAALLGRMLRRIQGLRVAIVGEAVTATALHVAESEADVALWVDSIAEANEVATAFRHRHMEPPRCCLDPEGCDELPIASFDRVLLLLPRGRPLQRYLWRIAAALVHPQGHILFVGERREGIKSAIREGEAIVEKVAVLYRKGGLHAGIAQAPTTSPPFPKPTLSFTPVEIEGEKLIIAGCEGVFAAGRLDAGAAALIQTMAIERGEAVLDMGCGSGVVGLAAARRGAIVTATDVSALALYATRATFKRNRLPVRLLQTVGGQGLPEAEFDVVVANPPFHSGRRRTERIAELFIREAHRVLKPGGRLYLVANAFLPYRRSLLPHFPSVAERFHDGHYRVWVARRGHRPLDFPRYNAESSTQRRQ